MLISIRIVVPPRRIAGIGVVVVVVIVPRRHLIGGDEVWEAGEGLGGLVVVA